MATQAIRYTIASTILLLAAMFTSSFAYAQCGCPSGGGDAPKMAGSSAASVPNAIDLLSDPAWQAQESTSQGVRFMQMYNRISGARVAVLQTGETGWAIQTNAQTPVTGRTAYRDNEVEVIYYRQSNQDRWIVRPVESAH